jgi:endoglycosylceramidase
MSWLTPAGGVGIEVSVTGGEVVSAPNAADLVIASNAGASAVTVSPAGT